jgi:hypothetical protein
MINRTPANPTITAKIRRGPVGSPSRRAARTVIISGPVKNEAAAFDRGNSGSDA